MGKLDKDMEVREVVRDKAGKTVGVVTGLYVEIEEYLMWNKYPGYVNPREKVDAKG